MQLHQILRFIESGINIVIFDLQGNQILNVRTKESIHVNYYEYDIFSISVGMSNIKGCISALYITIQK